MNETTIDEKADKLFQRISEWTMKSLRENFLLMRISTMYKGGATLFFCYLQPFLVLFYAVLFSFCILTFYRKKLIGVFHAILFLSNFLEIIAPIMNFPITIIFVFFSDIQIPMPYPACLLYHNLSGPYRTILHIAAQHLNVLLCFNRIVAVYKPFQLKIWFSKKRTTIYCVVIIAFTLLTGSVVNLFLPGVTSRKWVDDVWGNGNFEVYSVCSMEEVYVSSSLQNNLNLVYMTFVLLSTFTMIAMNIALFKKMRHVAQSHEALREVTNQNDREERRLNSMNRIAVLTILTLVIIEIPHLALKSYAWYSGLQIHLYGTLDINKYSERTEEISTIVVECLYPVDLVLFVLVSKKMRKAMFQSVINVFKICQIKIME